MTAFRALRSWGPSQAARRHAAAVVEEATLAQAALITQRAERLDATIAHITGSLALWTGQDQLDALDGYLAAHRRARSLPRYAPFTRAVKEASLILRAMPASPAPAGTTHTEAAAPVPLEAEVWGWPETALPPASPDPSGPGNGSPPGPDGGEATPPLPAGPGPEATASPGPEGAATPDSDGHPHPAAGPEPGEPPARTLLRLKPGGDGKFTPVPQERAPRGGFGELGEKLPGRLDAIFGNDASDSSDADDPGADGQVPSAPDQSAPVAGSAAGADEDAPGPDSDPVSGPGADGGGTEASDA